MNEFANSWYSLDTMRSNMFAGMEDDEEERYDQGTINQVPGDIDTEQVGECSVTPNWLTRI